ncbi:hypothetical protein J132_02549, partial [Termitomyces sp. J132]
FCYVSPLESGIIGLPLKMYIHCHFDHVGNTKLFPPGHINVLVRTYADGGWVFLTGDSGHHWLVTECEIPTAYGCAHVNKEAAQTHLELFKNSRPE